MKNLMNNEEVILSNKSAKLVYIYLILIGIVCIKTVIIPLIILYALLKMYKTTLYLTNKRVVKEYGIFTISTEELIISKIESVATKTNFIGISTIVINGTGGKSIIMRNIDGSREFSNKLQELISK